MRKYKGDKEKVKRRKGADVCSHHHTRYVRINSNAKHLRCMTSSERGTRLNIDTNSWVWLPCQT